MKERYEDHPTVRRVRARRAQADGASPGERAPAPDGPLDAS